MKKFLILIVAIISVFLIQLTATASTTVMPRYISLRYTNSLGLYEVGKNIVLYKSPNDNSPVLKSYSWTKDEIYPENTNFEDIFTVFIPSKELAMMTVMDENEDWVQVVYNNKTGATGWIKKDDPYKFMTWVNFYNMYGRKYGLYMLQGCSEKINEMKSGAEETSQTISTLNHPETINLNVISGNWALVSVMDIDRTPKTGYVRWRADDGIRYLFPDIK